MSADKLNSDTWDDCEIPQITGHDYTAHFSAYWYTTNETEYLSQVKAYVIKHNNLYYVMKNEGREFKDDTVISGEIKDLETALTMVKVLV